MAKAYDLATLAKRSELGGRTAGIVVQRYGGTGYAIAVSTGPVPVEVTGLAAGTASHVRVSASGRLERVVTPAEDDDYAGWCDASGLLHAMFGLPFAASAGAPPAGTGIVGVLDGAWNVSEPGAAEGELTLWWMNNLGQWVQVVSDTSASALVSVVGGTPTTTPLVDLDGNSGNITKLSGDPTTGALVTDHITWGNSIGVGRFGGTILHNFANLGPSRIVDIPWANARGGIVDIRCVWVNSANRYRIQRTYDVAKTSGGVLSVAELGTGLTEGTAIAGTNITLANAGNVLRMTIANATSGACNVSVSYDGDRQVIP